MGTTDYSNTFIRIAEDCPVSAAEVPVAGAKGPTIASLQYEIVAPHPYEFTSDDVLFRVHAIRQRISAEEQERAREAFFAKPQACLRASPLGKRYGWGIHHDEAGRIALVAVESERYGELTADPSISQTRAMRSKRA
ncbi:DUF6157 family protein [Leucobacter sp. GX24907]